MSQYCTWQELAARYAKIADDYSDAEAQQALIDGAAGEIDSRLGIRYTVPFSPVPAIIKDLAIDMAYYRATWQQDHEEKLQKFIERRLSALVSGSASLVVSGSVIVPLDVIAWNERDGIRSVFGPDDASNYSVSKDWQETAQNERNND